MRIIIEIDQLPGQPPQATVTPTPDETAVAASQQMPAIDAGAAPGAPGETTTPSGAERGMSVAAPQSAAATAGAINAGPAPAAPGAASPPSLAMPGDATAASGGESAGAAPHP